MRDTKIEIHIKAQQLKCFKSNILCKTYLISSGEKGVGTEEGSYKTPLGRHEICEKIGENLPKNSIFVARQWTGEIYDSTLNSNHDFILSRILRLSGLDADNQNTKDRYIYIHGTPDKNPMGIPLSLGCIRMRNDDIIALFDQVAVGTRVDILYE